MKDATPRTIHRSDYGRPDFVVDTVVLRFELDAAETTVSARMRIRRNHDGDRPLLLSGKDLELLSISLDGGELAPDRYGIDSGTLIMESVPDEFELSVVTRIQPARNTALEGLYRSAGNFCTQCEAEGFRRITWYPDRPDVMAKFTTTIVADAANCPVMLSNGNLIDSGRMEDGRHWVTWEDPFPKPSYLFALVAGDLACVRDRFVTVSGREVRIEFYVEHGNEDKCGHAIASLKNAMRWDEQTFGLEYDLDIYMVVAVSDFNMGAMENKGLNVFNTCYVLASADTATDGDYRGVESVIGHEYFHNWTGNRVTCRDWFQLSLKEGLTVFRDQQFSSDMGSAAVNRIEDVRSLRGAQFIEDAGPMAHPVRPDSYMEINNFYTATVYNKGAEVVRMIHTLLGEHGFRRGMDLYLHRHDGQAVACDDFVVAMEDANDADLGQFRRWYSQAGTPVVEVEADYNARDHTLTLTVEQSCPPTPEQPLKQPFHMPLKIGLVGGDGNDLALRLEGDDAVTEGSCVMELRQPHQQFRFVQVTERPIPSLLRGFSAPVKLKFDYSESELAFLLAHDSDAFNRWEAGQRLAVNVILDQVKLLASGGDTAPHTGLAEALRKVLNSTDMDPELAALVLTLPAESYVGEFLQPFDVDNVHLACKQQRRFLAQSLRGELLSTYERLSVSTPYSSDAVSIGRRALRNRCLAYLVAVEDEGLDRVCLDQYYQADNMTDAMAALVLIVDGNNEQRQAVLDDFYQRWQHDALVLDKWFSVQARSSRVDTLEQVRELLGHAAYAASNPNRVRALIGSFCGGNIVRFHVADGGGYRLLADQVIAMDASNPQLAARLLTPLSTLGRFDPHRRKLMSAQLERIVAGRQASPDVFEIVSRSLQEESEG